MSEIETAEALSVLREHLSYDSGTGQFTWVKAVGKKIRPGKLAGNTHSKRDPYTDLTLRGVKYRAHRVAWAFTHNEWPKGEIDHINQIKWDNRIANLRDVNGLENHRNQSRLKNNTTGVNGVTFEKSRASPKKYRAVIRVKNRWHHLGYFLTLDAAAAARAEADQRFGFHRNHGNKKPRQRVE